MGLAAVQLARAAGAKPYVTAGSQQKIDKAKSVGALDGINRHVSEGKWKDRFLELTDNHGADVILDCVGATYALQNAEVLATEGRWVLYGTMGGTQTEAGPLLGLLLRKRGQILASTLRTRSLQYKADLVANFVKEAWPKLADGTFQ